MNVESQPSIPALENRDHGSRDLGQRVATTLTIQIQLNQITKDYGRLRALDSVTLAIGSGVTGLLGPNGSGKSTLIKALLGLVEISSGDGQVLGLDLRRQSLAIRSQVGYMPEDDCYIAGLSGVAMVQFSARLAGLPAVEGLRRAHEILDFCGMKQERYRHVETYSTGMRQKVKFAQAIVHDPPLLILDEPTSGLDPDERQNMLARIRSLSSKGGKTVLVSTHILPDVQAVCDAVVILAQGRVRAAETLEILRRPTSPTIQVRVVGTPERLVDRLRCAGMSVVVEGDGTLAVTPADGTAVLERLWQIVAETRVVVRSLLPASISLEQIFLDAVRGDGRPGDDRANS